MSREAFEARYDKSRLRRWDAGIYPEEYSDPQVQLDWSLWQAAQDDAFERAAKVCLDQKRNLKATKYVRRNAKRNLYLWRCAEAIRALAKDVEK